MSIVFYYDITMGGSTIINFVDAPVLENEGASTRFGFSHAPNWEFRNKEFMTLS